MFIVISPTNPDPMYKQVMDQVKDAVAKGALTSSTRLPSVRVLAKELKISEITVKRAYSDLEKEGIIITRAGLGTFVAEVNKDKMREEKMNDIRTQLKKILNTGKTVNIPVEDIIKMIQEISEENNEQ